MTVRKFSVRQAFLFSAFSVIAGFARFVAIRHSYGDVVFQAYTLCLPIVLCLSEFLNLFADTSRHSKVMLSQRQMNLIVFASVAAVVLAQSCSELVVVPLVLYANLDAVLFVEVANRKQWVNMSLLAMRWLSVGVILFDLPYGLSGISVVSMCIMLIFAKADYAEKLSGVRLSGMNIAVTTVVASRLRDWLNTLIMQKLLPQELYFAFYLTARVLQNISGLTYQTIRSTYKINTTFTFQPVLRRVFNLKIFLGILVVLLGTVAVGFGAWAYLFASLLENLACQFFVFGYGVASKIMLGNLFGVLWSFSAYAMADNIHIPQYGWFLLALGCLVNVSFFLLSRTKAKVV